MCTFRPEMLQSGAVKGLIATATFPTGSVGCLEKSPHSHLEVT